MNEETFEQKKSAAKKILVCTNCGSPRVFADAFAALNTDEVRTYDDTHCDDCEGECKTTEVEVPDDFDIYSDFYKFPDGERSALDTEDQEGVL